MDMTLLIRISYPWEYLSVERKGILFIIKQKEKKKKRQNVLLDMKYQMRVSPYSCRGTNRLSLIILSIRIRLILVLVLHMEYSTMQAQMD